MIKRIAIKNKDGMHSYCIANTKQAGTVTGDLAQFDNTKMQQLDMCHRLVSSYYSLNLEIVYPTKVNGETAEQYHGGSGLHKGDGDTVEHTSKGSNPYNVERHLTTPEEEEVSDGRYDPQSYIAAMHGYLIYWLWSKHVG